MRIIALIIITCFTTYHLVGQDIPVMTYNIRYSTPNDGDNWWENRKAEVVKLVAYYHPDFLGIQEGLQSQVEYIDTHLPNYRFIGVGRDDGKKKGEYTALYFDTNKYDLISENTFWLSETPDVVSVGWDASMERICTYGQFRHKETQQVVYVFNAHFDHRGPGAREHSAKLIVSKIKQLGIADKKIIVMGDFNCLPDSKPIAAFRTLLDDAAEQNPKLVYGPNGTFNQFDPNFVPDRRIDYIFSKGLTAKSYRHVDDRRINNLWPSDHLPVLAIFQYRFNSE